MLEVFGLSFDKVLVLGILLFTVILSISAVTRMDVVAVLVLVLISATRILPPEQLFSGFSSEAVISLIAIMIISAGLEKSGIALRSARLILKLGGERSLNIANLLMVTSALLSSFMRNVGAVALLLPVIARICMRTGFPKSRFLMPVAFCSILGGGLTMIGSGPLIMLNSLLKNAGQYALKPISVSALKPFHLFEVFPVGLSLLLSGLLYFALMAKYFFVQKRDIQEINNGTTKSNFLKIYGKGGDIFELSVGTSSPLVGGSLRELESKLDESLSVLAVKYEKELHFPPLRKTVIHANSILAIMGTKEIVLEFAKNYNLKIFPRLNVFAELLHPVRAGLCEAVVPPSSQLIGQDVRELHMRRTHQLHVLALYRGNTVYRGDELKDLSLRSGDTLGMFSRWDALANFNKNPDFVVMTSVYPREEIRPRKMPYAIMFFVLSISLIIWGEFPLSVGLMMGAIGMIASGVLTIDEAYATVSWKTVFLLAGLIPLGLVIQITGTAEWLTSHIISQNIPIIVIQTGLAIMSSLFALFISNIGATVVFVPIALDLAMNVGADPRLFALTVAIAASNTFLIPTHQVNALIAGPGTYKTADFIKVGGIMTVIYWIVMLGALHIFF